MEQVILVDENDNQIGVEEKLKAHQNGGKLHRAFSIMIFNSDRKILIQQRASHKYHCGGIWANACCSHPRPDEKLEDAIHRRLKEEVGFDTELRRLFSFIYNANFENGLSEKELDYVFIGIYNGVPKPNPDEIDEYKWLSEENLKNDILINPDKYAPWFKIIVDKIDFKKELEFLIG